MTTRFNLRLAAAAFTIGTVPLAAHAQHVVTEAEASKLTLEALTAAPRPVYRPIYRVAYYRPAFSGRFQHGRAHAWSQVVTRVSYRTAVVSRRRHHR